MRVVAGMVSDPFFVDMEPRSARILWASYPSTLNTPQRRKRLAIGVEVPFAPTVEQFKGLY
jgi:hypothetical protein